MYLKKLGRKNPKQQNDATNTTDQLPIEQTQSTPPIASHTNNSDHSYQPQRGQINHVSSHRFTSIPPLCDNIQRLNLATRDQLERQIINQSN